MKVTDIFTLLTAALLSAGLLWGEELPQIRKAPSSPFNAKGMDVKGVMWKYADRIGGLVNPRTKGVELCASTAQMLYDENNLYISLRGNFKPEFRSDRTAKRSLFSDNNFEIFLKAENSDKYYQIAISEGGLLYTGVGRTERELPGIRKYVFTHKNHWIANLIIPLKSIGLSPEDQKIRLNICRYNIDMPKGSEQQSSFTVGIGNNYHVPDLWSTAVLTAIQDKPKSVWPQSKNFRINLMPDPGFDFVTTKFSNPDIQRQETQLLSKIWIIRATGKVYQFWSTAPRIPMKPGQKYTLKIRARRIGNEGALGCVLLLRTGKRFLEHSMPFWNLALTPEFHDYYFPIKAPEKNFNRFVFYRQGKKGNDTGVEVENISLYEGQFSGFEIRNVSRVGVKKLVPGTEVRLPDNPYGKAAKPLTVLAIGRKLMVLADATELFTGLNVSADQLAVTDKNSDTYYTPGDPKRILSRLEKGEYDLYMIGGSGGVGERIGTKLAEQIIKNVQKGAGLFWNAAGKQGNIAKLLKSENLKPVAGNHLLKQSLPVEMLVRPAPYGKWNNDPLNGLREGRYGKGRIVVGKTFFHHVGCNFMFQMIPDFSAMSYEKFPWSGFNKAWLARIMYYTAGKMDASIADIVVNGDQISVKGSNVPDGTVLNWRVTDKVGGTAASGKSAIRNNQAEITLPELSMSGNHVFSVHALDANGKTVDYFAKTFSRPGPRIVSLKDVKLYHKGADKAEIEVAADGIEPGMKLNWHLEDFSGRVIGKGTADAGKNLLVQIPLESLYTNQGNVEIRLCSGKQVRDVKRIAVFAQDRDRKRLLDDFTPSVWNFEPMAPGLAEGSNLQLEKIGIRSYLLAFYGPASLKNGMGSGTGWMNNDIFFGFNQRNNHIRKQQFNTPGSRKRVAQSAVKKANANRYLGSVCAILCDEPGLIGSDDTSEVDEHPDNIAEYRVRMKAKYGTIEEFNRRMGTAYDSFEQVKPGRLADARKSGKYGEFIEWRNFNVDRWCEAIKLISDATRAVDPEVKFSCGDSFGECPLSSTDYWKLITKTGADFSHEYTSMVYQGKDAINNFDEFYRSFNPNMRIWGHTGYFFSRSKAFFQPWWFALHRYGGFNWFGAYCDIASGGGSYNLLDFTGGYTQDAANLEAGLKKSNLLNGLGKLFLAYEWLKNDVAVYYSHDSCHLAFLQGKEVRNREIQPNSPLWKFFYSRQGITWALEELLYQYDFVAPEQICAGLLKHRKVLFMPSVSAMSDAEVKAVKKFIADGGRVIADFLPGEYDELGKKREKAPFTADEVMVLNAMFNNKNSAQKQRIFDALDQAGSKPLISVADAAKVFGREAMHFVHGNMHVFAILRDQTKSKDSLTQTFTFPVRGHIYDLRAKKYLGQGNQVTAAVANGDAGVWGVYPYQVKSVEIQAPETMKGCQDFVAKLQIKTSEGKPGRHIIHAELIPPKGEARFFLKRNLLADNGKAEFRIRIAENDLDGTWTLKVTDVLTGVSAEKKVVKKGK